MGFPVPSTVGATVTSVSATTLTPTLPTRANTNLLISHVQIQATGKTPSVGGVWTLGDTVNTGSISAAWAWCIVDGTEAAPVWSWAGAAACVAQVIRYTGNATPTGVGAFLNATADASTTVTTGALVTTADNSLCLNLIFASTSQTIPLPDDRTSIFSNASGNGSTRVAYGQVGLSGSTTDSPSVTITAANWISFTIEVLGTGVGSSEMRATEDVTTALESYSTPIMPARSTQVSEIVMETYSVPIMQALVTEVVCLVLRSVSSVTAIAEAAAATDEWRLFSGPLKQLIEETGNTGDQWVLQLSVSGADEGGLIRDPWDCDDWGRWQPGAGYRKGGNRVR